MVMRFLLASLVCLQFITIGCHDATETEKSDVVERAPTLSAAEELRDEAKDAEIAEKSTKHLESFLRLLPNNPEAAWIDLEKFAKLRYGNHPLVDEWVELTFRFTSEKKALVLELIRHAEIEIQMLTDIDAEKHANEIKDNQIYLKENRDDVEAKQFQSDIDPQTYKIGFELSIQSDKND